MGVRKRRLTAWLLTLALALTLVPVRGRAALSGVYLTAVNEKVMPLDAETMPFWSDHVLYVSNKMFEGTDLGVNYVRNSAMNLGVLYTPRSNLQFDLDGEGVQDKQGTSYEARAIRRGDYVFFPVEMVCDYFGLNWSYNETDIAPVIRVTSDSAALNDSEFIDAAFVQISREYELYKKMVEQMAAENDDPLVPVASGQKIHLVVDCTVPEDTREILEALDESQVTFLLTAGQMEDGDLLRGIVAGGHGVALRLTGGTEGELEAEIEEARALLWQAACAWLDLVWYEGEEALEPLFTALGCSQLSVRRDESEKGLSTAGRAYTLLRTIGRYREDLTVFLGSDSGCLGGLEILLEELEAAQYNVTAWRAGA